ncbi:hypothetical protein [Romboutsia ilealis]|uniref:hypothetical protein n=1 Tax=Romboutsia ilealis TaxID=1115758 RepID=UPI00272A7D5C|nr:hypothetical protein [Romboutsia ilealis]
MMKNNSETIKVKVSTITAERLQAVAPDFEVGQFIAEKLIPQGLELAELETEVSDELVESTDDYLKDIEEMVRHISIFLNKGNVKKKKGVLKLVYKLLESIL